ncbi:MAG: type I-C CRISPR-associated protein Cas7/Csd2, partial [Planctomycetota bacterium]
MTTATDTAIQNRYDFVYFFDVTDGNPNGDPDAGNLPRIDPETGQGLVTDVCLKRKIRNYVGLVKEEQPPYEIYVKEKAVLNAQHERAYLELKLKPEKRKMPKDEADARALTRWMCDNFFDIRTFGAVMSTDVNCGQVRGPVQLG